jgi:DNA-binding GntR family transcriptional regulator
MSATINSLERSLTVVPLVDALRSRIISRKLKHGDSLTENALAAEFGISRGSVRAALKTLEAEGVVITLPNGRKQVLGVTEKYVHDIFHTCMVIECEAARQILALKHVDFTEMAALVSRFQEVADAPTEIMREERSGINMQFHRALVRMAQNRPLLQCWYTIDPMVGALIGGVSHALLKFEKALPYEVTGGVPRCISLPATPVHR